MTCHVKSQDTYPKNSPWKYVRETCGKKSVFKSGRAARAYVGRRKSPYTRFKIEPIQ